MKRALCAFVAVFLIASSTGCHHGLAPHGCGGDCGGYEGSCDGGCGHPGLLSGLASHLHPRESPPATGPPVGTVTYPYYTVRGPRDFLANDPPSLGR